MKHAPLNDAAPTTDPPGCPQVHEKQTPIGYSTLDAHGAIKMVSIMNFLQDAASEHAARMKISGLDLARKNLAWVIHRYRVEIHTFPAWLSLPVIRTHRRSYKNLYDVRHFTLVDPDKDSVLIQATGAWVMVDKTSGRPVRLNRFFSRQMMSHPHPQSCFGPPLPGLRRTDHQLIFNVRMHDLDLNAHVNNAIYLEWAVETLPRDMLEQFRPETLEIVYLKPAFYGDGIVSCTEIQSPEGKNRSCLETVHAILRQSDREVLSRARIHWIRRKDKGSQRNGG